ncbi:MAG: hypothetical protein HQL26_06295 [Candidatus Omnitrophica bacterium]|nr:hypothetical protein [Candidatus Omnitrophota bacterium]
MTQLKKNKWCLLSVNLFFSRDLTPFILTPFIFFICFALFPANAFALYYSGGPGYTDTFGRVVSADAMVFSSVAAQSFMPSAASTPMAQMAIAQDISVPGGGVTAASGIRIRIPSGLNMTWDGCPTTTATITGSAVTKVSTTVNCADSSKTMVISVNTPFSNGDSITVSGLSFVNFNALGSGYLGLDITNNGSLIATDPYSKEIGGFSGGTGYSAAFARAATVSLIGMSSGSAQSFLPSAASTPVSTMTIYQDTAIGGTSITAANDIRIKIPSGLNMTWNTGITSAAIGGPSMAKVAPDVTYENSGKTLVINVSADFVNGDSVTVGGLSLTNFNSMGQGYLGVEIDHAGNTTSSDTYTKEIGPYSGGTGESHSTSMNTRGDPNGIQFATPF